MDGFFTGQTPLLATGNNTRHNMYFWPDLQERLFGSNYGSYSYRLSELNLEDDIDTDSSEDAVMAISITKLPHVLFSISGSLHQVKTYIFFPKLYVHRKTPDVLQEQGFVAERDLKNFYDNFFLKAAEEVLPPSIFNKFHLNTEDSKKRKLKNGSNMFCDTKYLNLVFNRAREMINSQTEGHYFRDFFISSVSYGGKQVIDMPFFDHRLTDINFDNLNDSTSAFMDFGFDIYFSDADNNPYVSFLKESGCNDLIDLFFSSTSGKRKFHPVNLATFGGFTYKPGNHHCIKFICYSDFKQPFYYRGQFGRNGKDFNHISIQKRDVQFTQHIVSVSRSMYSITNVFEP